MSIVYIFEWLALTILIFLVLLGWDAYSQFKLQISYVPPRGQSLLDPAFRISPSLRHSILLGLSIFIQYAYRYQRENIVFSVSVFLVLFVVYYLLLARDIFAARRKHLEN